MNGMLFVVACRTCCSYCLLVGRNEVAGKCKADGGTGCSRSFVVSFCHGVVSFRWPSEITRAKRTCFTDIRKKNRWHFIDLSRSFYRKRTVSLSLFVLASKNFVYIYYRNPTTQLALHFIHNNINRFTVIYTL